MLPAHMQELIDAIRKAHDELCPLVADNPDAATQTFALWSMAQAHNLYASFVHVFDAMDEAHTERTSEVQSECARWRNEYTNEFLARVDASAQLTELVQANAKLAEMLTSERAAALELRVRVAHLEDHIAQALRCEAEAAKTREEELRADVAHMRALADRAASYQSALHAIAQVVQGIDERETHHIITSIISKVMDTHKHYERTSKPKVLYDA